MSYVKSNHFDESKVLIIFNTPHTHIHTPPKNMNKHMHVLEWILYIKLSKSKVHKTSQFSF